MIGDDETASISDSKAAKHNRKGAIPGNHTSISASDVARFFRQEYPCPNGSLPGKEERSPQMKKEDQIRDLPQPDKARPSSEEPQAQPPEDFTGLKLTAPKTYAAGVPAVIRSMQHISAESGILRGAKALMVLNQKHGIDCMSCAWPEPDGNRRIAEFCENGAKAVAWEADSRQVTPAFFEQYSVEELSRRSDYWLGQQGRIMQPMVLRPGTDRYEAISWDDAFQLLSQELNSLASPDEAIFYTSGRASNEAAFAYQLFVRQFGTNNLPDCSNMCHESSGSALTPAIGIGKGTVTLDDFGKAQVILIIGQNPGTNHPRMLTALKHAKDSGAKIVSMNPLIEPGLLRFKDPQEVSGVIGKGTVLSDLYLQVRINGDVALLKGIMKELLAVEDSRPGSVIAWDFVREKTHGWDEFIADLRKENWESLETQSGLPRAEMQQVAELLASSERIIACWAMGLTQHKNAVGTIQEIVNLLLMRGSIGKPGAGVCPVRGHSNVQGDRTMGIWERPKKDFLDRLQEVLHFDPPRHDGFDTVESIKAMYGGKGKVFFALGGNFLSATPDTEYTAQALRNTSLTVHVSTKLNRSHLVTGKQALILPCLGRTEIDQRKAGPQFVTTENSMGVVEISRGRLKPSSEHLLSEPAIVCRLAKATLGSKTTVDWDALADNYDKIRDLIAACIPGCDNYNEKVRQPSGFYLPNGPREGNFDGTPTGKANFTVHPLPDHSLAPGQLVMMTIRSHDQFNTTIYGLDDYYRGIFSERRVILLNPDDIRKQGLQPGDIVDLTSHWEGEKRIAKHFIVVPYNVRKSNCATYFPEANVLVPVGSVAEHSNTPVSKFVIISLSKAAEQGMKLDATWIH
jgi:molybdopterin-dependent oxidoreductase alpha subunit